MTHYTSADSPNNHELEQFNNSVQDTSKLIQAFHQTTRSIQQKMTLFNTPQDNRVNHQQLKELTDKGNSLVTRINKRLQDLNKVCQGAAGRTRRTQVNKLSNDYKNQLKSFEETCHNLVEIEKAAVANIRRQSSSFRHDDDTKKVELGGYNEDQIYAQVNVTKYDEDDLARREEDIIHINHQLREVNAAFREVDDLIAEQGEVVVQIEDHAEDTKDRVEGALEEVRQADTKRGYCQCGKTKMICYGLLVAIIVIIVLSVIFAMKK